VTFPAPSFDAAAVRSLAQSGPTAEWLFGHFANREYNSRETKVDTIVALKPAVPGFCRTEVVRLLKGLEAAGCGVFVEGRRGGASRIVWSASLISVGQAASDTHKQIEALGDPQRDDVEAIDDIDERVHRFWIREDYELQITLPADLSAAEAARVAGFLQTLPITT
jgi:hypothetical protein